MISKPSKIILFLLSGLSCVSAFAQSSFISGGVDASSASSSVNQSVSGAGLRAPVQTDAASPQRVEIRNTPTIYRRDSKVFDSAETPPDSSSEQKGKDGASSDTKLKEPPPSDFELFVLSNTGKVVKPYGLSLFQRSTTFSSVTGSPVPADYAIGPGDEVHIRAWGGIDIDYRAVVDRAGQINIPKVGTFTLAGTRASELDSTLRAHINKYFTNFQLSAGLGQLRAIQVYVVGQAANPGMYTVPSLSSLVSAVFQVAMPGSNGSYRAIQLKRNNKIITELDLYDFIASGDTSRDVRVAPGDVIVVTPAGPRVAVLGAVDSPAIYELKPNGESLASVLKLAGSNRALTNSTRVQLERVDAANPKAPRVVDSVDLKIANSLKLADSDVITLFSTSQQFANAVTLRGNVAVPLRYPFKQGMRIRDLIPEKEALVTSDYFQRKNALVQVMTDKLSSEKLTSDKKNSDKNVSDKKLENDVRNILDEVNFDYAVIERLDKEKLRTQLIPFNLGKVLNDAQSPDNLELIPGDVVTVFGVNDVAVPKSKRSVYVRIAGEVNAPGIYQANQGETLRDLLKRIGGFTQDAYEFGITLTRESTRKEQELRYQEAIARLERDLQQSQIQQSKSIVSSDDVQTKGTQLAAQRAFLDKLRSYKPTGRIVLDIPPDLAKIDQLPAIVLEDGDSIFIPHVPDTVSVYGAVFGEGSFLYKQKRSVGDFISQAGGSTRSADSSSTFVIRANGSVVSNRQSGLRFLMGIDGQAALPGDTVYVPEDFERTPILKTLRDITQIFSQFGLGAAAIQILRKD
jgi:protein involved in polysaccharide export with SLBB domain